MVVRCRWRRYLVYSHLSRNFMLMAGIRTMGAKTENDGTNAGMAQPVPQFGQGQGVFELEGMWILAAFAVKAPKNPAPCITIWTIPHNAGYGVLPGPPSPERRPS